MSDFGAEQYAFQLAVARQDDGTPITIQGKTIMATTQAVSQGLVGLDKLPNVAIGQFIASADPRVFRVSPDEIRKPVPGEMILWQGGSYQIARIDPELVRSTIHTYAFYAYKANWLDEQIASQGDTTLINGQLLTWNGGNLKALWSLSNANSTQPYTHEDGIVRPSYLVTLPGVCAGSPYHVTWGTQLTWNKTGFKGVVKNLDFPGSGDVIDLVVAMVQITSG